MFKSAYIIALISLLLVSCSSLKSSESDYLQSQFTQPLRIPSDLSSLAIESHYIIPPLHKIKNGSTTSISLIPPRVISS